MPDQAVTSPQTEPEPPSHLTPEQLKEIKYAITICKQQIALLKRNQKDYEEGLAQESKDVSPMSRRAIQLRDQIRGYARDVNSFIHRLQELQMQLRPKTQNEPPTKPPYKRPRRMSFEPGAHLNGR